MKRLFNSELNITNLFGHDSCFNSDADFTAMHEESLVPYYTEKRYFNDTGGFQKVGKP